MSILVSYHPSHFSFHLGSTQACPPVLFQIPLIPTFDEDWHNQTRLPIGESFVGGVIGNRIVLWGGLQAQGNLPTNVIYTFTPFSGADGMWKKIQTIGDVHRGFRRPAFMVLRNLIYIFGGTDVNRHRVEDISTLSADGKFIRLNVSLQSVIAYEAWPYNGSIFLFGCDAEDGSRSKLVKFDPLTYNITSLEMEGSSPLHNYGFTSVKINHRVFVYGYVSFGESGFFTLDLKELRWSKEEDMAIPGMVDMDPNDGHSLSRVSSSQLLLFGGRGNHAFTFDIDKSKWREEKVLASKLEEKERGLKDHQTFELYDEYGVFIFCIGGRIDAYDYANYIRIFYFPFNR